MDLKIYVHFVNVPRAPRKRHKQLSLKMPKERGQVSQTVVVEYQIQKGGSGHFCWDLAEMSPHLQQEGQGFNLGTDQNCLTTCILEVWPQNICFCLGIFCRA